MWDAHGRLFKINACARVCFLVNNHTEHCNNNYYGCKFSMILKLNQIESQTGPKT